MWVGCREGVESLSRGCGDEGLGGSLEGVGRLSRGYGKVVWMV